jgi:hypothetical protein
MFRNFEIRISRNEIGGAFDFGNKFEKSKDKKNKKLVDFYLKNTKYINNWDLVDLSCYKLFRKILF